MKKYLILTLLSFILTKCLAQTVIINEVSFTNKGFITDMDGDSPDWFELYNSSVNPVNLSGYLVTDDTSKTEFWSFPEYMLLPGDYLLVFASGKDTIVNLQFHTSFKLGNMKESLFLINPRGELIDVIEPQCVPANYSLSRIPDGNTTFTVTSPTPGGSNNSSEPAYINFRPDTLIVSLSSGFYADPVKVTLSNLHSENRIMYTLDGDDPDEDSEFYAEELSFEDLTPHPNRFANIPETEVEPGNQLFKANILRARVYSDGCPASNDINNTYFIGEVLKSHYSVPVVSLITDRDNLFDDETGIYVYGKYNNLEQHGNKWERPAHVEIFDSTGNLILDQNIGIRIHGRGSRRAPQKSFRLIAKKEYGPEFFEYPLFNQKPGLSKFENLLMRTTSNTRGPLFKEELSNHLVQEMNIDYSAGHTAIMFLNGEYWGIYNLMERQNREYLETNYHIENAEVDIISYDWHIKVEDGTIDEYEHLINYLQSSDPSSDDFYHNINSRIDIDALIDYYSAQLYFANTDWPWSNVELWKLKNDTARWRYFFFDLDAGMMWINEDHLTEYNNEIDKFQRYPEFCTIILRTLMKNDEFRSKFYNRIVYHMNHTFEAGRVIEAIDQYEKKYSPMVPEHIYRWRRPVDYFKWQDHVHSLKTFAIQRPLFMMEQLRSNFGNPVSVYPNPGTGSFRIQNNDSNESIDIRLYSPDGKLIQEWHDQHAGGTDFKMNAELPGGLYILQIRSGMHWYPVKMMVNRPMP